MSLFNHPLVATVLKPGMKLMRAMHFPTKMALMAVVLIVPLAWLTAQAVRGAHEDMALTRAEGQGIALVTHTLLLIEQVQVHRGLSMRVAAGDVAAAAPLDQTRRALKAASDALNAQLLLADDALQSAAWRPTQQVLDRLLAGDLPSDAGEAFQLQSAQVQALRRLLALSAERSGLLLEPDAAPYHRMDLSVRLMTPWTEALGQLRGRGAGLVQRGSASDADRAEMIAQVRLLEDTMASVQQTAEAIVRAGGPAPAGLSGAVQKSQAFAQRALAVAQRSDSSGSAAAYFDAGTEAIAAVLGAGHANTTQLQALLEARLGRLALVWWLALAAGIGAVTVVSYMTIVFFRTSFGAVRVLQGSVAQLAAGDFATRVRLRGTDELSVVGQSLDAMTGRLSEMVSDIRSNSSMVAQAGLRLAEDTKSLSERTEAQAASLEQTAASVQEISGAVQRSVESSQAAAGMAARVRQMAEDGGQTIQAAVASMQDIQSSSRRVNDIVGVIDGIAFQTNILALNAAVEAARAGEHGRGFAVVAAEVRTLAQRSSASAREIKALIGASTQHVDDGVAQIGNANQIFDGIVAGVREVADSVETIHTSAAEQSRGLTQIAQAVQHIDEITQRNAQMVESAFHNSSQLSGRAERLAAAVASFKLRQGSADEALALVRKARALYESHGTSALARITDPASGLSDRDMYVFAFDRQGIYRAFAGKSDKVGTAVRDNPGVDGDKLVRDAFEQAARGGGWVDYDFANPQTGAVDLKTSYVEPVGADLVIGCGIYKVRGAGNADGGGALPIARGLRAEQKRTLAGRPARAGAVAVPA